MYDFFYNRGSASQFISDKQVAKSAMLAGSFTAWSMESNPMVKCHLIRLSAQEMIHLTRSFRRLGQENMYQEPSL